MTSSLGICALMDCHGCLEKKGRMVARLDKEIGQESEFLVDSLSLRDYTRTVIACGEGGKKTGAMQ